MSTTVALCGRSGITCGTSAGTPGAFEHEFDPAAAGQFIHERRQIIW